MSSGGVLERPPRPEPTRISPYFFKQLTPLLSTPTRTAADAAERAVESNSLPVGDGSAAPSPFTDLLHLFEPNPSGPHRDRAGVPAPIFAAAAPLSSAQHEEVQKGRLQRQALQEALWSSFTPPTYTAAFTDLIVEESDVTERLRRAVSAAWAGVEKVTQRNAERRARFAALTAEEAPWRSEVQAKVYWQAADIVARYGLEVGGPTGTEEGGSDGGTAAKGEDDDEHVLLDFSVLQQSELGTARLSPSSSSAAAAAADHQAGGAAAGQRAKAWTTSTEELLDPCARDYPLRRIFAPLQRERPSLPKWTTLLLEETQRVQKAQLPDLEARLRASVLFKVPLHRPFQAARAALQVCATQQRTAPSVEEGQVTAFRQVEQLSRRLDAFVEVQQAKLRTASEDGAAAATSSPAAEDTDDVAEAGERWATAEALWTMLLTELDGCKRFLADAVPRCTTLRDTIQQEQASVQAALMRHRSSCEDTFTRMKAEAQTCAELLTRNSERTLTAVAEMEEKFSPDEARLSAAISHRKAELVQLEGQQEKNVRRLREAVKACFVDQMKYEEAAQALLQDQLSLAQLQVSHQQLRQAVQVRHEGAIESRRHAAELTRLLEDGDGVAHAFFTACDAHLRRIENDDYFIQCRLVDQCTVAIQQRCRCLHAIAALYDQRYIALDKRAGGSWQLQFLLSGEQDWAVANLADVRAEFAQLDQDWAVVRAMRAAMEMDAAELDALVHTAEWSAMQSTLLRLDAPAPLQRRLPTLRAHSANLSNPAAGRGPQAVRRLLTS